jgi:hypothetical protein
LESFNDFGNVVTARLLGENEGDYWNNTSVNTYQTEEDTEHALRKLLEFNRPSAAIEGFSKLAYFLG